MFLRLPFQFVANLQDTVLILNTILLIAALIVVELVYSEIPREQRRHLLYFLPLILVLIGLLIYAVYLQTGKA